MSEPTLQEKIAISPHSPRVEACINAVMEKHHGTSHAALARYYEAVHQELAPLARQLEKELAEAKAINEALRKNWPAAARAALTQPATQGATHE